MTSSITQALFTATLIAGGSGAYAQSVENIFVNGARYVYDVYGNETILESVARLPNKIIVRNEMLPNMAKMYRTCAREAEFRGRVRAIGGVYSSHFSTVTLERHPSMKPAMFSASIDCVKRGVGQASTSVVTSGSKRMVY